MSELLHRGLHYKRTEYVEFYPTQINLEKILADEWEAENRKCPGVNYGSGVLQDLMVFSSQNPRRGFWRVWNGFTGAPYRGAAFIIRKRDAVIAATVVQWLGTNCGRAFLFRCLELAGYEVARRKESPHD